MAHMSEGNEVILVGCTRKFKEGVQRFLEASGEKMAPYFRRLHIENMERRQISGLSTPSAAPAAAAPPPPGE